MVANLSICLAITLKEEGGWSDNPRDPGGPTMKGITLATYSRWLKRPASVSELRNISPTNVEEVYRSLYWLPIGGDALPLAVAILLLDIAVNSGDGREHVWAAQTANLNPALRIAKLDSLRRGFWRHLPTFVTFGTGWFRREDAVFAAAKRYV